MGGYTSQGAYAIYDTLTEAQQKCMELSSFNCGGVTWNAFGWPSFGWQLRTATETEQTKLCDVITFIRPSSEEPTTNPYDLDTSRPAPSEESITQPYALNTSRPTFD